MSFLDYDRNRIICIVFAIISFLLGAAAVVFAIITSYKIILIIAAAVLLAVGIVLLFMSQKFSSRMNSYNGSFDSPYDTGYFSCR